MIMLTEDQLKEIERRGRARKLFDHPGEQPCALCWELLRVLIQEVGMEQSQHIPTRTEPERHDEGPRPPENPQL